MERVDHKELCTKNASKDDYSEKRNMISEESQKK